MPYRVASSWIAVGCMVLGGATACRSSLPRVPEPQPERVFAFSADESRRLYRDLGGCSGRLPSVPADYWSPSNEDAQRAARVIDEKLLSALGPEPIVGPKQFRLQMFGLVTLDGARVVVANGFYYPTYRHSVRDLDEWKRQPFVLCDAGMTAFQTVYSMATAQVDSIRFYESYLIP
jgi:hypothetical protein